MGNSRTFLMGMLYGALAGGGIALLNRETRRSVMKDARSVGENAAYIAKNPNQFMGDLRQTVTKVRTAVQQVSDDVSYIAEKVDEIREVTPQVADIVKDTKQAFTRSGNGASAQQPMGNTVFTPPAVTDTTQNDQTDYMH
ncbi:YtxH domain-containing protein [Mesobacillus harenae]|uniref:YtxH domain-containing protein n=1 Tax=Mesobacillus harenae TaxID=2213203 RepID=UPI00157FEC2C|nr:YtxH domain-containing protein [Mesobacillus harenae]